MECNTHATVIASIFGRDENREEILRDIKQTLDSVYYGMSCSEDYQPHTMTVLAWGKDDPQTVIEASRDWNKRLQKDFDDILCCVSSGKITCWADRILENAAAALRGKPNYHSPRVLFDTPSLRCSCCENEDDAYPVLTTVMSDMDAHSIQHHPERFVLLDIELH